MALTGIISSIKDGTTYKQAYDAGNNRHRYDEKKSCRHALNPRLIIRYDLRIVVDA